MAMRQCCDVYETPDGVKRYRLTLVEIDESGARVCEVTVDEHGDPISTNDILSLTPYLSPRGLERLKTKIETGTTPPTTRKPRDVKDAP